MKLPVSSEGVLLPKTLFEGINTVEIRQEGSLVIVVPVTEDPILELGSDPIQDDITDASVNHDEYLT